ncbi:MAG TPA: ice-binding family protein [Clostridiaceae bacterium]
MKNKYFKNLLSFSIIATMVLISFNSTFADNKVSKNTYSKVLGSAPAFNTAAVNLGLAGDYAILAKSGISSVPKSVITGNIGVSPITSTAITGFSLVQDSTNQFSTSTQVIGKAYAPDYTSPTASNLTTAVNNMETAYTDAAGRPANYTELYTGDLSGQTLTPGVYKWGTGVLINADVTLTGGPNDVFIFQIAKGITQASSTNITLAGGVQAKNIFWQTAGTVSIGTGAHFEGIILGKTNIALGTHATVNGRLFAQTAVTLIMNTVVAP